MPDSPSSFIGLLSGSQNEAEEDEEEESFDKTDSIDAADQSDLEGLGFLRNLTPVIVIIDMGLAVLTGGVLLEEAAGDDIDQIQGEQEEGYQGSHDIKEHHILSVGQGLLVADKAQDFQRNEDG
jgi:hypothetical protein